MHGTAMEPRKVTLVFIYLMISLDMLAMGILFPVLPKLVEGLVEGNTARTATILGLFSAVFALMQFLCSPLLGALSDHFGRRPVLLLSCLGLTLNYVVMALAPNLAWLFVAQVLSGITTANVGTSFAYIADVMPPERRAEGFGTIGAATSIGIVLGPVLGGALCGIDLRLPFWVASGVGLLNMMYGFFVLPESLSHDKRARFAWKRANPIGAFMLLRSSPALAGLATVTFLTNLAMLVIPATGVIYTIYRYEWSPMIVGLTFAGAGIFGAVVQGGFTKRIVDHFGEKPALNIGLFFGMAGLLIFGFAPSSILFWAGIPVMSLSGLSTPAVQGLMSREISASEQGVLQGANACAMGIAGVLGPLLFTQTFAYFIEPQSMVHLPGAPFFLASAILLVAGIIAACCGSGGLRADIVPFNEVKIE